MNFPAHIMLNYFALSFFIPEAQKYLLPIAAFSVIMDLDHLPGLFNPKEGKANIDKYRMWIQEPVGALAALAVLLAIYIAGIGGIYSVIAAACIVLHWLVDFLTVDTKPFAPFNNKRVNLFFYTKTQRLLSQIIITAIAAVLFLAVYF
jgi:hypothetical protein